MSEALELGEEAFDLAVGVAASFEVVAARFAVQLAGAEHVPGGDEDRVLDGSERTFVPAAWS